MSPKTFLFIHQNMPAQFVHLCQYLRNRGDRVVYITQNKNNHFAQMTKVQYALARDPKPDTHPYIRTTESGVLHAQSIYRSITNLLKNGYHFDMVIGHAGWGETQLVKQALPDVPLLNYFEFFYQAKGQDLGFDPEYPATLDDELAVTFKNSIALTSFASGDWGLTPTQWQYSTHPYFMQSRMSVIHDGVDTQAIKPDPQATFTTASGKILKAGDKVVTFVSRNLEPYRGFHIFMRSLPEIQRRHPDAEIIIVGAETPGYGRKLPEGESYKKRLLNDVAINADTVHFTGHLDTQRFRSVLQVSAAHVYLTYPFVLSWSMIEAMSSGCLIIGSRTPPVEEVIRHGKNGLLVNFFDKNEIANTVCEALARPKAFEHLRQAARNVAVARYDLASVTLPRQVGLLDDMIDKRR